MFSLLADRRIEWLRLFLILWLQLAQRVLFFIRHSYLRAFLNIRTFLDRFFLYGHRLLTGAYHLISELDSSRKLLRGGSLAEFVSMRTIVVHAGLAELGLAGRLVEVIN